MNDPCLRSNEDFHTRKELDRVEAQVRADRHRARKVERREWLSWLERELRSSLELERATKLEIQALDLALKTPGTEPQAMLARDYERREVPYYVASRLAGWVVRQRRAAVTCPTVMALTEPIDDVTERVFVSDATPCERPGAVARVMQVGREA